MSELMTDSGETIANKTGLIDDTAGMKNGDAEMMGDDTGMKDENSGMITGKKTRINEKSPKRKKRSRERGPDTKPRKYNRITLRNLKQFQNIPFEQTNGSNNLVWIIMGIIALLVAIIIWRIYEWQKDKNTSES